MNKIKNIVLYILVILYSIGLLIFNICLSYNLTTDNILEIFSISSDMALGIILLIMSINGIKDTINK